MPVALWALTTLDAVKDELGITDDSEDNRLSRMINAWSQRFDTETSRKLARASYVESIAAQGGLWLNLAQYPVTSVESVVVDDATLVADDDYTLYPMNGQLWRSEKWRWAAGCHPDLTGDRDPYANGLNVTVTYIAGYVTPAMAEDDSSLIRDLPYDLEDGVIRGVVFSYQNAPGVKMEQTAGGRRTQLFDPLKGGDHGILAELEPLWASYRKHDRSSAA